MVSIGERLREERVRLGTNQTAFGEVGGVTKKTQMLYEGGDRFPDAQYLSAIADIGVDVAYVLTGKRATQSQTQSQVQYSKGSVVALPVSENGGLTWRQVLAIAVDELNAAGKRLPGEKLLELADLLMQWQAEGAKVDAEKMRLQIRLIA
jgi:transcriptional regulator with XRE-family HTH domain